jgi:inosine-uridine nucleoside N-ribohydrolase
MKSISMDCMQIYADPEAADLVFTGGADTVVIGINLTTQIILTGKYACLLSPILSVKPMHLNYLVIFYDIFTRCGSH